MAPKDADSVRLLSDENEIATEVGEVLTQMEAANSKKVPQQIVWRNVIWLAILHVGAVYGLLVIPWLHPLTWLWSKY
jgi:stearoyl-CoA desaturase (delta-9 desaturase)